MSHPSREVKKFVRRDRTAWLTGLAEKASLRGLWKPFELAQTRSETSLPKPVQVYMMFKLALARNASHGTLLFAKHQLLTH